MPGTLSASPDSSPPPFDAAGGAPVLAIVCNSLTPYELHLNRRIAAELPVRLRTLMTNVDSSRSWQLEDQPTIGLVDLSRGERIARLTSPRDQLREWSRGAEVIRRLAADDARMVIVNGYSDFGRLRTILWCWRTGRPCYLRSDSNISDESGKGSVKLAVKRWFIKGLLRFLSGSLVVGQRGRDYWRHYGERDERIFLVPYTPDYEELASLTDGEIAEAAERHGLSPDRRRLVFSGRLIPIKRVDLLIDAFAAIADERPDWDLLILGDGELLEELQQRVPQRLRRRVKWTGFVAEQREVSRLYRLSDALALPSEREPWALVVNEAAAAGLAIVTSDVVGASSALVRSGQNGEVFATGDLKGLTDALRLVTAPDTIEAYRAASPEVLRRWRTEADPVAGVRQALEKSGVLNEPA